MAELNFGLLNPPGSQSIGNAFVTGMDQAAAARAQENQNALSQYTLSKARREDQIQNAINSAYQGAIGPDGTIDYGRVNAALAAGGAGAKIPESEAARRKAELDRVDLDIKRGTLLGQPGIRAKTIAETDKLKADARAKAIGEVASFPNADAAHAAIDARFASGAIDQAAADEMRSGLTSDNFDKWQLATLKRLSTPADQLRQKALTHTDTDRGGYIGRQYFDAQGLPSGPEQRLEKTITPSTAATLKQAQDHYNGLSKFQKETLAQNGWTFDSERGVAVNARRGISQPISTLMSPVGGGVPAAPSGVAAPAVPGVAGGGVPGQRQAPAGQPAAVAGVLGPKPEKLNESQGNATAYGLRMKEANLILENLARPETGTGTLRGANVEAIPFVGGAAGKVLPSFLGGTSEQQQQVNQAKSNFITAVLRKESGAVISDSEFEREDNKYFPQLNDGPKVIKQKENARRLAIEAMKFQAGPGAKEIDRYVPSVSSDLSMPPPGAVRPRRN